MNKTEQRIVMLKDKINAKFTAVQILDKIVELGRRLEKSHNEREQEAVGQKDTTQLILNRNPVLLLCRLSPPFSMTSAGKL